MSQRLSRRGFLRTSTAAAAAWGPFQILPSGLLAAAPNEKLNLAFVGVANKGGHNLGELTSQNIAALCDVDATYLGAVAAKYKDARTYRDYREMLDKEAKRIDAVVVSTADHTHAGPSAMAISMGKHVYCEKPLAHTVREARTLAELAAKHKVATQMGTQIHAGDNYRRVVEIVQSGALGKIKEVYNWCNKGWSDGRFAVGKMTVPTNLDWDLWLGPAQQRPFSPNIHPANWRRFWEYGSGTFGDMACHVMDLPFWALNLRHPTSVAAEGPERHPDGAPSWVLARYEFPAEGERGPLTLYWADGGHHQELVRTTKDHEGRSLAEWGLGILFVGDKGMLVADYGRLQLLPKKSFEGFKAPAPSIPRSIGHWNEWVDACKTGKPTTCNFRYSGGLTESVLLGVVAYRAAEKLVWNGQDMKVTNMPPANALTSKEYRKGFEVVGLV